MGQFKQFLAKFAQIRRVPPTICQNWLKIEPKYAGKIVFRSFMNPVAIFKANRIKKVSLIIKNLKRKGLFLYGESLS